MHIQVCKNVNVSLYTQRILNERRKRTSIYYSVCIYIHVYVCAYHDRYQIKVDHGSGPKPQACTSVACHIKQTFCIMQSEQDAPVFGDCSLGIAHPAKFWPISFWQRLGKLESLFLNCLLWDYAARGNRFTPCFAAGPRRGGCLSSLASTSKSFRFAKVESKRLGFKAKRHASESEARGIRFQTRPAAL